MDDAVLQLLVLAGIAIFLILRLKSVLGTRDGFEPPRDSLMQPQGAPLNTFEVIEGGPDRDIIDFVDEDSADADALASMKKADPNFRVADFIGGARGAYEMILMGFERGDLNEIQPFLSEDVYEAFVNVVADREDQGIVIHAEFIGIREIGIKKATFNAATQIAEITVRFVSELTSVVKTNDGQVIEGSPTEIKKQKDIWTFTHDMSSDDPNWILTATHG